MFCIMKNKIHPVYLSKHKTVHENLVILLMVPNGKGWHYDPVRQLPVLFRGITTKHHGDNYCFNFLHSFRTKNKINSHKMVCRSKDICNIAMPSEDTKILELYH